MTATAVKTAPTGRTLRGAGAFIATEIRLLSRDIASLFFLLAFPTVLLLGMGAAIPGMRDSIADLPAPYTGMRMIDLYLPVLVAIAIATAGLSLVPAYLATYRETGVLRRLGTTPLHPVAVVSGTLVAILAMCTVGVAIAIAATTAVLGTPLPANWPLVIVFYLLGVLATFGVGLVIGGWAPKAAAASGIGMLLYFPMMFFAGMWTPGPAMPETVRTIAAYTPLGAASQALEAAWFDQGVPWLQVGVMIAWAVGCLALAAKTFRWR